MKNTTYRTRLALCCACALLLPAISHALDLTPHASVRQGNEGPPTPILEFTDGVKKITMVPPYQWLPDGGGKSLSLTAPGGGGAWMKLLVVPIGKDDAPPVTDASAAPDDLQAWAKPYLPAGAINVAFVKMVTSPFTVCTRSSTEYIFTISRYGVKETVSISAIDFSDKERLVVIFASPPDNFEKVRQTVIRSMFSWESN